MNIKNNENTILLTGEREHDVLSPTPKKTAKQNIAGITHSDINLALDVVMNSVASASKSPNTKHKAHIVKGGVGSGKTWKAIHHVSKHIKANSISAPILHVVENHKNAAEAVGFYSEHGIQVTYLKGKVASGCKKSADLKDMYASGLETKSLCHKIDHEGNKTPICEHYSTCQYIKQRQDIYSGVFYQVIVCTAENLRSGSIPKEIKPAFAIIDESPLSKMTYEGSMATKSFGSSWVEMQHRHYAVLKHLTNSIVFALGKKEDPVQYLMSMEDYAEDPQALLSEINSVIALRRSEKLKIASDGRLRKQVAQTSNIKLESAIWDGLAAKIEAIINKDKVSTFHMMATEKGNRIDVSKKIAFPYNIPLLILDASADEVIYERLFAETHTTKTYTTPDLEHNLQRIAVIGEGFSTSSLFNHGETIVHDKGSARCPKEEAEKRRETLTAAINNILDYEKDRKILVVCTSRVERGILEGELAPRLREQDNVQIAHFGDVKGINSFDTVQTSIILGKLELRPEVVMRLGRCLKTTKEAYAPEAASLQKSEVRRTLHTKDGRSAVLSTYLYRDDIEGRIQQQNREEEIVQAEGRLRFVNRTDEDLRSYIISDAVPSNMIFDDVYSIKDVAGTGRLTQLADEYHDVISGPAYVFHYQAKSRQAFNQALEKRGISPEQHPDMWVPIKCKIIGARGNPPIVYYRKRGELNAERVYQSVFRHFMKIGHIDIKNDLDLTYL